MKETKRGRELWILATEMFVSYYVERLDQAIIKPTYENSINTLASALFWYGLNSGCL